MRKILIIARCEFIEMLKTKTFIISTLFAPLIMGGIMFFSSKLVTQPPGPRAAITLGVTDLSGQLAGDIQGRFLEYSKKNSERQILFRSIENPNDPNAAQQQGKADLRAGGINTYVVIHKDIITGPGKMYFYTYKPKPSDMDISQTAENMITGVVIDQRCKAKNISSTLLKEIRYVPMEHVEIGDSADKQRVQKQAEMITRMMVPFFFMFMIYMGIMVIGQQILSSIIEEKSSRIIEILLSAVSPFELMAGKILGLTGIGLAVMALWVTTAYGTARWQGLAVDVSGMMFFYLVVYYILGFVFFSAILAGIGAICNTIKESQSLMTPAVMICIVPMISWFNLVQSPNGLFARVLSFIPPITPLVMVLRLSAASDISIIEIIASIALMLVSVLAAIWVAAKIFRTGILMYGKRPSFREVFRWLRQS
jgi:ABC-2 type transport system permease protein